MFTNHAWKIVDELWRFCGEKSLLVPNMVMAFASDDMRELSESDRSVKAVFFSFDENYTRSSYKN